MPISVTCPDCKKTFRVKDELSGKKAKCIGCGQRFVIQATQSESAEASKSVRCAGCGESIESGEKRKLNGVIYCKECWQQQSGRAPASARRILILGSAAGAVVVAAIVLFVILSGGEPVSKGPSPTLVVKGPTPAPTGKEEEAKSPPPKEEPPLPPLKIEPQASFKMEEFVAVLAFAKDGKSVFAVGDRGRARIADSSTGSELVSARIGPPGGGSLHEPRFFPVPMMFGAVNSYEVQLETLTPIKARDGGDTTLVRNIARKSWPGFKLPNLAQWFTVSPDGQTAAAGWNLDDPPQMWAVATGKPVDSPLARALQTAPFAKGARLDYSNGGQLVLVARNQSGEIWDVATGAVRSSFREGSGPGGGAFLNLWAFTPDDKHLVMAYGSEEVWLHDVNTGAARRVLAREKGWAVGSLALSGDGKLLAIKMDGPTSRVVKLCDVATGRPRGATKELEYLGKALALSPDGRALAVAGSSGVDILRIIE